MMPGTIGTVMPRAAHASTKCQYASALKKYCVIAESAPALTLRSKFARSSSRAARLRVIFRIGGDVDVEPVAGLLADERDELARVAEFAGIAPSPTAGRRAARPDAGCRARGSAQARRAATSRDAADARDVRRRVRALRRGSPAPSPACPRASTRRRRRSPRRTPASAARAARAPRAAWPRPPAFSAGRTRRCRACGSSATALDVPRQFFFGSSSADSAHEMML